MTTLVVGSSASLSSHSRSFGGPKCSNGSLGQASSSHSVQSVTMRIESMESRSSHLPPIAPRRISLEASSFHSEGKIRIDSMDNSFNDSVSSFGSDAQLVKQRETAKRSKSSDFLNPVTSVSPQAYFDAMIKSRGYSTQRYPTLKSGYSNNPTPLQQASYDVHLMDLVRSHELDEFQKLLDCGLSPNPMNGFGESLVHAICRRGSYEFLSVLVDAGCDLQVSDNLGRTPLHEACWSAKPNFRLVERILFADPRMMLLTDCRGATPLSYVAKKNWPAWLQFLESVKDDYWPVRDAGRLGAEGPPPLICVAPGSRPMPDPARAPTLDMAHKLASGQMAPEAVQRHDDDVGS